MLQRLDGELHINQTTKGLNVNLLMKPTRRAEKSLRGHEWRSFNLSLVEEKVRDLFSQSMVTNEVALTFNWSSKRRDIHLANQWSSMKMT